MLHFPIGVMIVEHVLVPERISFDSLQFLIWVIIFGSFKMRLGIWVLPLTLLLFQGLVNKNTKNCQMGSNCQLY